MGISNREWLYSLDVADLADWFDSEHVEDAISDYLGKSQDSEILSQDSDMDNDGLPPENGVSVTDVDSNDANAAQDMDSGECVRMCPNDSREKLEADVITTFGDGLVRSIIMRLLDRQVAITCNEQREWWGGVVGELQERVDTLTRYIHDIKQIARKV